MFLLTLLLLLPGPIAYQAYSLLTDHCDKCALALSVEAKAIANITASFAYTMMGFLAALITILFAVTATTSYRRYARRGYLSILFYLYFLTLISLIVTGVLSVVNYSSAISGWGFKLLIMSFGNNLVQVAAITVIISNLAHKASVQRSDVE